MAVLASAVGLCWEYELGSCVPEWLDWSVWHFGSGAVAYPHGEEDLKVGPGYLQSGCAVKDEFRLCSRVRFDGLVEIYRIRG